ncbi:MAG: methyltransferase domain-containing protein [Planctomycetota bacterium]
MSRSKRSAVQRYHDRVSGCYDDSYDDAYWQWHNSLTWDYLKPYLPRDLSVGVLDLGCGTGTWACKLRRSGYSVTCVDISTKMLDQARLKIERMGGSDRIRFVQADLCDLSALPAAGASLAIALGDPVGCTRSPALALKQIRRVLADDGVLVATFDNRLAAIDHYLILGDPQSLARFLRDGRTNWLTKDADERFPITTFGPDDLRALLETAGFEVVEMVGKTVLPMRHHRHLLETSEARRTWAKIEKSLCRNPFAVGRASHLQVACRLIRG